MISIIKINKKYKLILPKFATFLNKAYMKRTSWPIFLGLIVFLSAILISFTSDNPISSQLCSSLSVIAAAFIIHHQVSFPKKENAHD